MKVRLDVFESGFQAPPLSVKLRHACSGRRLPGYIRQDMQQRLPVSGRLCEFEAQAPPLVHVAVGIDKANALLGDTTRFEVALRSEWAHNLKGQPLMLPDHEKSPVVIELSEKFAGTKVAIGNPQIIR